MIDSELDVQHSRPWWTLGVDQAVDALETDPRSGLNDQEAARRLERFGPNELEEEPGKPPWLMFVSQFANTMIVVLLLAAGVTVVIGDVQDAVVIAAIVVLNAVIGFVQEYRAEQAMHALRSMAAPFARVIRSGAESTIPAAELVPGDLMILEAGDIVPADARLLECPNLRVNESALTGESVPVGKRTEAMTADAGEMLAERRNMVFKGTSVVYGRGRSVVANTGMSTALGQIAGLLKAHQAPATPLQKRLAVLGRWLAAAALVVCLIVFVAGVARGEDVTLMFLTAVSLAVAAIPEALPAVVTIALALGAQRMAKQNALIRKLPAVETLGSVTVICSDKTGTLTQGRMQVERAWTLGGEVQISGYGYEPSGDLMQDGQPITVETGSTFDRLIKVAALCNDAVLVPPSASTGAWSVAGDPTEGALLSLAAKAGAPPDELREEMPRIEEIPFDSQRKLMTTVNRQRDGSAFVATKGAAEAVVEVVTKIGGPAGDRALTDDDRLQLLRTAEDYAENGYRVLALAGNVIGPERMTRVDGVEQGLTFLGLVAMADPPRPESQAAVAACREAGITPVMITGDHPATAQAIAGRLHISDGREVITGRRLASDPEAVLAEHVEDIAVYARTTPEQKLDIVHALKGAGHVVAMTGDGVNDAPALQSADIGVAMGLAGTDVAKEAADMVLTDDNFATIVAAVGEGRRIYDNIRRFVRYTLTSNTGEIWVMLLGPFLGMPLPLLPVHILWVNLVTDGLPGLALGIEQAEKNVMRRPPRPPTESIFSRGLWQHVLLVGLLMGLVPLGLGVWGNETGRPWQTMVFTSLALLQLGHALAVRSEQQSLRSMGLATNRVLIYAILGTMALQFVIIYIPFAQELLETEALSLLELGVVLVASTVVLLVVEAEKAWKRSRGV